MHAVRGGRDEEREREKRLQRRVGGTAAAALFAAPVGNTLASGGPQTDGEWAVFGAELLLTVLSVIFGWRK